MNDKCFQLFCSLHGLLKALHQVRGHETEASIAVAAIKPDVFKQEESFSGYFRNAKKNLNAQTKKHTENLRQLKELQKQTKKKKKTSM